MMTDNHTELCKKLREEIALFKAARIDPGRIVPALAMIESQAARIAELQRELEAARQERNAAGVKARRELMPAYEARIAELEKERDALKADAERYRWVIASDKNATALYVSVFSCGPNAKNSIDAEMDAAIQDEKETRS